MKSLTKNENGVALLMVMGVIAILSFLLAEFTFDTKLNKIKVYNQQDKAQARLTAEAGLNFALARLKLYQVARNKLEKEESLKKMFSPDKLEAYLNSEFAFPLPLGDKDGAIKKSAINDFQKNALLRGQFVLTVNKISGFLNPNALRIKPKTTNTNQSQDAANSGLNSDADPDPNADPNDSSNQSSQGQNQKPVAIDVIIEKKLTETLNRLIEDKNKADDQFNAKYSNLNASDLVKELKYFVNDRSKISGGDFSDVENKFQQKNISAKHAPMTSIDELYLLPSWDDEIVALIKDRLSVHEVGVIGINELTTEDLKILFPNITPPQIEEFFKSRDGDKEKNIDGKEFENEEDFKNRLINDLRITSVEDYDTLSKELKSAKMRFDVAGKLFKITSLATVNNTNIKLVAFVDLPIKDVPPVPNNQGNNSPIGNNQTSGGNQTPPADPNSGQDPNNDPAKGDQKPQPLELLTPRVVELRLE